MASARSLVVLRATVFLIFLLIASPAKAQPAQPSPANVIKQTIYNGASRYVYYQVPPDAPPRLQALYRALGQAENDQYLSDQLQQLLLEYTDQERMLGSVRTSRELLYGPTLRWYGASGYVSPDGVTKAATVQGLVAAADARARFAGQINRELELLQREAAGRGKAGGLAAHAAARQESIALGKQRTAWQNYQAASRRAEEAARLVEQAKQFSQQAAEGKQSRTAIQRLLYQCGLVTSGRYLAELAHGLAQRAAQEAKQALGEATVELHAAQVETMSAMRPAPVVSNVPAAIAPKAWPAPPTWVGPRPALVQEIMQAAHAQEIQWNLTSTKAQSARAESMAALAAKKGAREEQEAWLKERDAFLKEQEAWQKEASATPAERSAALAARREAQRERFAAQQERTALLVAEAAAQRAHGSSVASGPVLMRPLTVVSSPVRVPAAPSVPSGAWMVAGVSALGTLLLIGFGLPLVLYYRRLAFAQGCMTPVPPDVPTVQCVDRRGLDHSASYAVRS
jgi:hypothetical protein